MKKRNFPQWLPDWRNESVYPDPETTTPKQWAWEFLRRNSKYQEDFEKLRQYPFFGANVDEMLKLMQIYPQEYKQYLSISPRFRSEYGLDGCAPPPEVNTPRILFFTPRTGLIKFTREMNFENDNRCAIIFDLGKAIEPQLKRAGEQLRQFQKDLQSEYGLKVTQKNRHPYTYRQYLRMLDAKAQGATNAEIEAELFPDDLGDVQSKVKKALRQAKSLRDCGYKHLL